MPYSAAQIRSLKAEADAPHYAEAKRRAEFADAMRWAGAKIDTALHSITGLEPDWQLRAVAKARAAAMLNLIRDYEQKITPAWINEQVTLLQAAPLAFKCGTGRDDEQLQAMVKRATCHLWWRRQLRRAAVSTRETAAMHAGEVCARRRQPYVTNDTVRRYELADKRNREMLEATELESADGEVINLLQAVEASTANKAIRRGELMTRIRGAEEWAEARGMVGLFTTNTTPSRFHSQLMRAGANPKHDGSTPKDAQQWLCKTWARARAALQRRKVRVFGYRVAEPHHDGCPHWHMLLWCDPAQVQQLRETIRAYWLADAGDEPGAQEHRFKAKDLDAGGAVSYVAKYISKGIDDAGQIGAEGHTDERGGEQAEMFDGNANRVQRWAAAWGIRQFQSIGQPPVTVWRELRRVTDQAAQGATITVQAAHAAVSKTSGRRACWRAYMDAQGGAMQGRAYAVRVLDDGEPREGRYGTEYRPRPVGVFDVAEPDQWILSNRREWKARGAWAESERVQLRGWLWAEARPQAAQPWTRVINCTQGRQQGADLMSLGLVGALRKEPGAAVNQQETYETHPPNHRGRSSGPFDKRQLGICPG
ncbi:replication endonuclease [Paucibacter sp. TC2R-5]|uniref:replication endonuclease n=1 Tax=Paucibacter sp. TC2R-5 TaxID=2893555 RepID=UPI0021E4AB32|nr:replication endonuclease [Paucibacter sp. TC2R-5]MCV2361648.1 replication endonuclease [Paucibacter sp. TC2R-5]